MLTEALPGLAEWTARFAGMAVPVLRRTSRQLTGLAASTEEPCARDVATTIAGDPLATIRLFAFLASHRRMRQITEITSVEGCVIMMGVPPLMHDLARAPCIEESLHGRPEALRGLLRVVRRSRHAARLAWQFGAWRNDLDAGALATAALLHDFVETLLWAAAPELALEIDRKLHADPSLRSRTAQRAVLNIEVNELQVELATAWQLPELYRQMMDDSSARHPRALLVMHSVALARHSALGWDNPALPDDYRALASLLNTSAERVRAMAEPDDGARHAEPASADNLS